jgi:hypothetical protein
MFQLSSRPKKQPKNDQFRLKFVIGQKKSVSTLGSSNQYANQVHEIASIVTGINTDLVLIYANEPAIGWGLINVSISIKAMCF